MGEPIEVPFEAGICGDPRNHVLGEGGEGRGLILPTKMGQTCFLGVQPGASIIVATCYGLRPLEHSSFMLISQSGKKQWLLIISSPTQSATYRCACVLSLTSSLCRCQAAILWQPAVCRPASVIEKSDSVSVYYAPTVPPYIKTAQILLMLLLTCTFSFLLASLYFTNYSSYAGLPTSKQETFMNVKKQGLQRQDAPHVTKSAMLP